MHRFHVVRTRGASGRIRTVWSLGGDVARVAFNAESTRVERVSDATETHAPTPHGWHLDLTAGAARSSIDLGGRRQPAIAGAGTQVTPPAPIQLPFATTLHAPHYRRSEQSWEEAGSPTAHVSIAGDARRIEVTVTVRKAAPLVFVDADAENPLDNEPAEINADGVQLYVVASGASGGWTIVPDETSIRARARRVRGWDALSVDARWSRADGGYALTAVVTLPAAAGEVAVGVVVNETEPGRARRRGQLVLGGRSGEWIYLLGDRHAPELLLPVRMVAGDLMF